MTLLGVAGWVLGGIALLVAAIVAFVRVKSGIDETTADLWKEEAEAWKARAERLEVNYSQLEKRVEHLENENRMLRALHDNSDALALISQTLADGLADIKSLLEREAK